MRFSSLIDIMEPKLLFIISVGLIDRYFCRKPSLCHAHNKKLVDEVFVICGIINVEVRVISRAEGEADNSYRDIDNFAYYKNRIR